MGFSIRGIAVGFAVAGREGGLRGARKNGWTCCVTQLTPYVAEQHIDTILAAGGKNVGGLLGKGTTIDG